MDKKMVAVLACPQCWCTGVAFHHDYNKGRLLMETLVIDRPLCPCRCHWKFMAEEEW